MNGKIIHLDIYADGTAVVNIYDGKARIFSDSGTLEDMMAEIFKIVNQ